MPALWVSQTVALICLENSFSVVPKDSEWAVDYTVEKKWLQQSSLDWLHSPPCSPQDLRQIYMDELCSCLWSVDGRIPLLVLSFIHCLAEEWLGSSQTQGTEHEKGLPIRVCCANGWGNDNENEQDCFSCYKLNKICWTQLWQKKKHEVWPTLTDMTPNLHSRKFSS